MNDERDMTNEIVAGERVRSILERAAQLDASGLAGVRRNELQKIAAEAGISAAAFEQAMEEAMQPVNLPAFLPPPAPEPPIAWWRVDVGKMMGSLLGFGALGAVLGFWGSNDPQGEMLGFGIAVLLATTLYQALAHRKDGDGGTFRMQVISMFTGIWFAYSASARHPSPDVQSGLAVIAALATLIGSAIVSYRGWRGDSGRQNAAPAPLK